MIGRGESVRASNLPVPTSVSAKPESFRAFSSNASADERESQVIRILSLDRTLPASLECPYLTRQRSSPWLKTCVESRIQPLQRELIVFRGGARLNLTGEDLSRFLKEMAVVLPHSSRLSN